MSRRLPVAGAGLAAAAVALSACSPGTVLVAYAPEEGDTATYRYDIVGTVTQALEGEDPVVNELDVELEVVEEVLRVEEGAAVAELTVRRDGGPARTVEVRLDRSGGLAAVDLVEGSPAADLGLEVLQGLAAASPPPPGRVAPGQRWVIDDGGVDGEGRLARLAIADGKKAAVVDTTAREDVDEQIGTGGTTARLEGTIDTAATTTYLLDGGTVHRASSRSRGSVGVLVQPPAGVTAEPARGTITYDLRVRITRLD